MSVTTSSDALSQRFASLARDGRKALVTYMTAGHPDPAQSVALMRALEADGVLGRQVPIEIYRIDISCTNIIQVVGETFSVKEFRAYIHAVA